MKKLFTVIGMCFHGVYWIVAMLSWLTIDCESSAEFSLSFKLLVCAACFAVIVFAMYLIDAIISVKRVNGIFNWIKMITVAGAVVVVYATTDMVILNIYAVCLFAVEVLSLFVVRKEYLQEQDG